jgi:hypothetical protein
VHYGDRPIHDKHANVHLSSAKTLDGNAQKLHAYLRQQNPKTVHEVRQHMHTWINDNYKGTSAGTAKQVVGEMLHHYHKHGALEVHSHSLSGADKAKVQARVKERMIADDKRTSYVNAKPAEKPAEKPVAATTSDSAGKSTDPATIARMIQDAVNRAPKEHGYGPDKVFIHRAYEAVKDKLPNDMSLDRFKKLVVSMQRNGRLQLVRADLVGAMDRNDVSSAHINDNGADFHFITRKH